MNIETIYNSLLERSYHKDMADQLAELAEKFPYCQALHFARLQLMHESNNVGYNDYLKLTAAYSGNREYLYGIINGQKTASEIPVFIESNKQELAIASLEENKSAPYEATTLLNTNEDKLQQIIDQRLRELNVVRTAPSPEFNIDEFMLRLEEQKSEGSIESTVSVDETIDHSAESNEVETNEELTILPEEKAISNNFNEPEKQPEPDSEPITIMEELVQSDDPIDKLIVSHALQEQISNTVNEEIETPLADETAERSFTGWLRAIKKPLFQDPGFTTTNPAPLPNIIEKFIREEPRITPSRSSFYSPVNMAKQSITEHEDLVSETLAKIYSTQGNYEKAISAFEKLSLQHPEKSTYFAALILELKQKQKL